MKPIYVYFAFRHNKKENRMIAAVGLFGDPEGTKLGALRISELTPWDSNDYIKIIQSYANALNYIYNMQSELDKYGYDTAVLMTNNKILHGWITKGESHGFKEWFAGVHRPFRTGSNKEIKIRVALGELAASNPVYQHCRPDKCGQQLEQTYRGVRVVPAEEVRARKEMEEQLNDKPKRMLSIREILERDELVGKVTIDGID